MKAAAVEVPNQKEIVGEIELRPNTSSVPLSYGQEQIWLHSQLVPAISLYNEPVTIKKTGELDVAILNRALSEIVRRHESWRTTFVAKDGQPVQVVHPAVPVTLRGVDLRHLPASEREREALRLATEDALRPFDLTKLPLFRGFLVHMGDNDHRIYLTLHHIIFDGTSIYHVLIPELDALYSAYSRNEESRLPDLPMQFADFAVWRRKWMAESPAVDGQLDYWRNRLDGIVMPSLPFDHQRPAIQSFRGAIFPFALDARLSQDLRNLARRSGSSLFMTLLAALGVLLYRYSGSEDIAIGTVSSSRKRSEVEGLLGYFLNPVVLRNDFSGDPSFRTVMQRVRNSTLDALSSDDVPFTMIVNETHAARTLSCNPLIQVLFTLEPPLPVSANGWSVALTQSPVDTGLVKFDLVLELDDAPSGIAGRLKFNNDLFDTSTIARMTEHFKTLLQGVVDNTELPISRVPFMTAAERTQSVVEWNETKVAFPRGLFIHDLFETAAKKNPDAIAVVQGDDQYTYGELNDRADALGSALQQRGVNADTKVGVCLQPSFRMLIAIFGILKAGGAYVPLDPSYPKQRLQYIAQDADLHLILTDTASRLDVPVVENAEILSIDSLNDPHSSAPSTKTNPIHPPQPSDQSLAYVFYTSGTSGTPRGVAISHSNLVNSTQARLHFYKPDKSKFLLLSSFAFDSSVAGIFGTLCSGGTLILCPDSLTASLPHLSRLVEEYRVTDLLCVPSVYGLMLEQSGSRKLSSLRNAIVAGEPCTPELVERHYRRQPGTNLFNEYGPTEASVWATVYKCEPQPTRPLVPIGRPIANVQVYVLDQHLQPVPVGVPGELCIAGTGVARGYWNRPELTVEQFVSNPFGDGRLYRTGDLVRYLADGNIELLGRKDEQIKIRGFRIELDEISSLLTSHPAVHQAIAIAREDTPGQPEIVAYVVGSQTGTVTPEVLRQYLKDRLPDYMLPSAIVDLESLPLLPNGKIDRPSLPFSPHLAISSQDQPKGVVEEKLADIFEQVLNKPLVGATQNFFELGGHSLLLAQLMLLIEQTFGTQLSWAEVFRAPNVRELATLLSEPSSTGDSSIIPIQPEGSKPPLFWVRGGPLFLGLCRRLGKDQPVLGLDLPPADAAHLPLPYRLEDIAAALIGKMRTVQSRGPYNIAGLCVNGVIAYEMARQLQSAGQQIGVLALFDAQNPEYYHHFANESRSRAILNKLDFHLGKLVAATPRRLPELVRERLERAGQRLNVMRWRIYHRFAIRVDQEHLRNLDTIIHPASYDYRPKPLAGKVLFFQSSDWPNGSYWDFFASWKHMVSHLDVCRVEGGHESMFAENNVAPVVSGLRNALGLVSTDIRESVVA